MVGSFHRDLDVESLPGVRGWEVVGWSDRSRQYGYMRSVELVDGCLGRSAYILCLKVQSGSG